MGTALTEISAAQLNAVVTAILAALSWLIVIKARSPAGDLWFLSELLRAGFALILCAVIVYPALPAWVNYETASLVAVLAALLRWASVDLLAEHKPRWRLLGALLAFHILATFVLHMVHIPNYHLVFYLIVFVTFIQSIVVYRLWKMASAFHFLNARYLAGVIAIHNIIALFWAIYSVISGQNSWQISHAPTSINALIFPLIFSVLTIILFVGLMLEKYVRQNIQAQEIIATEKVKYATHFDGVTQLPNRALALDLLQNAVDRAKMRGHKMAVFLFHIDKFEDIHSTYDFDTADHLVARLSQRMKARLNAQESLCRLQWNEFLVILPEVSHEERAIDLAQALLAEAARPMDVGDQQFILTLSCGISILTHQPSAQILLSQANMALSSAFQQGGNIVSLYNPHLHDQAHRHAKLSTALHQALSHSQFEIHYQPVLDLKTGKIICVEALLRWHHPELGQVSPSDFLPIAERNGLISPIGAWVLRRACQQAQQWQNQGIEFGKVSVNISAVQFARDDIGALTQSILNQCRLPAHLLNLEITESESLFDIDHITQSLSKLRRAGVGISVDDFGTGYASFGHIRALRPDILKLDRMFVANLARSSSDQLIVRSIIEMARNMGIYTIAEGVEDTQTLALLRSLGCDAIQGYYFAKPMPGLDVENFIADHRAQMWL